MANFPEFQHFPTEIRLKIWSQAANDPQIVNARLIWDPWGTPNLKSNTCQTTTSYLKGLLRACQESCGEVIRKCSRNLKRWGTPQSPVLIYFNPSIDTLWFPEPFRKERHLKFFLMQFRNDLDQVHSIAYPVGGQWLLCRLADIFYHVYQLKRLYLTDCLLPDGGSSDTGGDVVLLKTNSLPEGEIDINIANAIKANCRDPSLVMTWEIGLDWSRIMPKTRIRKIGSQPRLRQHTWALGCYCEFCQKQEKSCREKKYHSGAPPLPRRLF
ncbi:hypothetical protein B0J14DRAFT_610269 [Halenospora varia]|nr:hypothetical protein B0J14DRAFT_610269 [Halenospora varia]